MGDEIKKGTEAEVEEPTVDTEEPETKETEESEEETTTEQPTVEPKTETATAEPAKTETPKAPEVDVEAEVEKRLTDRLNARMADVEKKHAEDKQRAIDAVIKKERTKEDSARKVLRDFEARYGMPLDKAAEANRQRRIEHLMTEKGWSEEDARSVVALEEERALARAREEEEKREREEFTATTTYRQQKLDFLSDPNAKAAHKKALQKYGSEVDAFSDHGRGVEFMVALKYVAGEHLDEIEAELLKESNERETKLKADIEAARKAGEQKAIRNITNGSKAKPETSTTGVTPPEASLTPMELQTAKAFGMSPAAYAKAKANTNQRPKS